MSDRRWRARTAGTQPLGEFLIGWRDEAIDRGADVRSRRERERRMRDWWSSQPAQLDEVEGEERASD
jgi:hypothetical protein